MVVLNQSKVSSTLLKPLKITVLNKFSSRRFRRQIHISRYKIYCTPAKSGYSFISEHQSSISPLDSSIKFPLRPHVDFRKNSSFTFLLLTLAFLPLDKFKSLDFAKRASFLLLPDIIIYFFLGHQVVVKLCLQVQQDLLPPPSPARASSQFTKIHGLTTELDRSLKRPFRQPHHSSSACSIIGGGNPITRRNLAHRISAFFFHRWTTWISGLYSKLCANHSKIIVSISRAKERTTFSRQLCSFRHHEPLPLWLLWLTTSSLAPVPPLKFITIPNTSVATIFDHTLISKLHLPILIKIFSSITSRPNLHLKIPLKILVFIK